MITTKFTQDEITTSYKKLKRSIYYDKADLAIRKRLALFESKAGLDDRLKVVEDVLNSKNPLKEDAFIEWIDKIDYRIVPKKIIAKIPISNGAKGGTFITNRTSSNLFSVKKVNYFFDGPIELHLIAVLWIMREGKFLDNTLGTECYGARLEKKIGQKGDTSASMFYRYHELYKKWRDSGIRQAKYMLSEEKKSVCILGLDIQEYYYHVSLDYKEIEDAINDRIRLEDPDNYSARNSPSKLLKTLKFISESYFRKISPHSTATHSIAGNLSGLPIGLSSSPLLANWYLRKLDVAIKEEIRPAYYGRYVDDIFLVVPAPEVLSETDPIDEFIQNLLVKTNILTNFGSEKYEIASRPGLFLQKDKCILQYFDVHHSIAALDKFQKKLEANGSDFLLLPVDEGESSLEDVAYELLYDGSVNKFRSVKGVAENRYELAKHLARQTMLHLLTGDAPDYRISASLIDFFKGKNSIEFHDLWERVFTFLLVSKDNVGFERFKANSLNEIARIEHSQAKTTKKIRADLVQHLERSVAMALALGIPTFGNPVAKAFRKSNLIRHHFVRVPLINYTNFSGSLISGSIESQLDLDKKKIIRSPRFVNFDECMLLVMSGKLSTQIQKAGTRREQFEHASDIFLAINRCHNTGVSWLETKDSEVIANV